MEFDLDPYLIGLIISDFSEGMESDAVTCRPNPQH